MARRPDHAYHKMADVIEGVFNDFVDELFLEVAFELHRAIKLGYYKELIDPDPANIDRRGKKDERHES